VGRFLGLFTANVGQALATGGKGGRYMMVTGLADFPEDERPPVVITHLSFQIMVGLGMLMVLVAVAHLLAKWRKVDLLSKRGWQLFLVAMAPSGFVALETGWVVTEVGRQPWIIYRIMRTADAVTPVPGLGWSFAIIVALYLSLGAITFFLLWRWFYVESRDEDAPAPTTGTPTPENPAPVV